MTLNNIITDISCHSFSIAFFIIIYLNIVWIVPEILEKSSETLDIGEICRFCISSLSHSIFLLPKTLQLFSFPIFDFELTWWRLSQKRVVTPWIKYLCFSLIHGNFAIYRCNGWSLLSEGFRFWRKKKAKKQRQKRKKKEEKNHKKRKPHKNNLLNIFYVSLVSLFLWKWYPWCKSVLLSRE